MNLKSRQTFIIPSLLFSLILISCTVPKNITTFSQFEKSNCYNQTDYHYTVDEIPKTIFESSPDSSLFNTFSFESLNIANATGILNFLNQFTVLKSEYSSQPTPDNKIALLELRQTIYGKINIASLEISSVTSELECEEERLDQISNYLKSKVEQREKNLVIGSIVVGAAGGITAEGLNNSSSAGKSGSYVAIGASLLEATLGILMLTNKQTISYKHERNTPGEIWNAPPVSKTLPPSIWYYLNFKDSSKRKQSLRELLIQNWTAFGQVENSKRKKDKNNREEIYFGTGGKYSAEELKNRADMYDQVKAYINLMKQDLKLLSIEFEKFTTGK